MEKGQQRHLLVKGKTEEDSTEQDKCVGYREHAGSGVGLTLARHPSWKGDLASQVCATPHPW